jgi:hypothetical protein
MFLGQVNQSKEYPGTIDDNKQNIIFENDNSKFYIPDEYENLYIIPKNDFLNYRNKLKPTSVHPILKNESEQILDFDTYTIDSEEGIEFLKNDILNQKKYVRSGERNNLFDYKPSNVAVLNPYTAAAVLNPLQKISSNVNPLENVALLVKIPPKGGKKVKKVKKSKKTRKHRGIIQTGGNAGRLQKGYKYSGKKLKNGMPEILKVKSVKK